MELEPQLSSSLQQSHLPMFGQEPGQKPDPVACGPWSVTSVRYAETQLMLLWAHATCQTRKLQLRCADELGKGRRGIRNAEADWACTAHSDSSARPGLLAPTTGASLTRPRSVCRSHSDGWRVEPRRGLA